MPRHPSSLSLFLSLSFSLSLSLSLSLSDGWRGWAHPCKHKARLHSKHSSMDKLQLTGRNLGRVFNFRSACMQGRHKLRSVAIWPNLELKTRPKQLLGSLHGQTLSRSPFSPFRYRAPGSSFSLSLFLFLSLSSIKHARTLSVPHSVSQHALLLY